MVTTVQSVTSIFDAPDQVRSNIITADGYRTHYLEAGDRGAAPLVLVHGGACSIGFGAERWYPNILPLGEAFRVFAVDQLGHGETEPPRNIGELAHVRVRAEHVIAFIEALDVGPVHLVGQSQGGWIVSYITLTRPDLVQRLVLVDSGSSAGAGLEKISPETELLPYFKNLFEPGTRVPKDDLKTTKGIRRYLEEFVYHKSAITDELVERCLPLAERWHDLYMQRHRGTWADGKETGLRRQKTEYSLNGEHISASLHKISVPTLVIWGKQSNKGVDAGYRMYKTIPDAQLHIFDKANHYVWMDQPGDFNTLVTWFLTKDVSTR